MKKGVKAVHNSKLISLGELSAGIMHEINNPLSIIAASVQLLKKSHDVPVQFANKCEQIEKLLSRILKIVSGLKRFSRSTENDFTRIVIFVRYYSRSSDNNRGKS